MYLFTAYFLYYDGEASFFALSLVDWLVSVHSHHLFVAQVKFLLYMNVFSFSLLSRLPLIRGYCPRTIFSFYAKKRVTVVQLSIS